MSEIKITKNSLENAILKDGQFVSGYINNDSSIVAAGDGAHANGKAIYGGYILAKGNGAHAEGYAGSIGNFILAKGNGAHAEGYADSTGPINASGNGAHAEGVGTQALAIGAHSEGFGTFATGNYSHASGEGTIANQNAMSAIGKYNVLTNTINTLFVVGDGTSSADVDRSDAFKVNKIGSNTGTNQVPSSVQAKVNGIPDVYLGCPIGTIVMWAGTTTPDGWLLCNGEYVCLGTGSDTHSEGYENGVWYGVKYQNLINVIDDTYGIRENQQYGNYYMLPNLQQRFPIGATNSSIGISKKLFDPIITTAYFQYDYNTQHHDYNYKFRMGQHIQLDETKTYIIDTSVSQATLNKNSTYSNTRYFAFVSGVGTLKDETTEPYTYYYNCRFVALNNDLSIKDQNQIKFEDIFNVSGTANASCSAKIYESWPTLLGKTGGEVLHTLSAAESGLPAHNYTTTVSVAEGMGNSNDNIKGDSDGTVKNVTFTSNENTTQDLQSSHNNIPPFLAINFIIKYK